MSDRSPIEILNASVLADAPMLAFVLAPDDRCVWMNRFTAKRMELSGADLECDEPFPLTSLVPGSDEAELRARCTPESVFDEQVDIGAADMVWIAFRVQQLRFGLRLVIGDDCTQRKQLEQQVAEERAVLRRLVDVIPFDVLWTDRELRYAGCNQSHAAEVGFADVFAAEGTSLFDELAMSETLSAGARQRAAEFEQLFRQVLTTGIPLLHEQVSYLGVDDAMVHRDVSIVPLGEQGGSCEGVLAIVADQTERVKMVQQMLQASKLEAVGQLAAGLAHEINTPVQFVGDNIRFMQDSAEEVRELLRLGLELANLAAGSASACGTKAAEFLTSAERADIEFLLEEIPSAISQSLEGTERIGKLVRAIKDFSHPGGSSSEPFDVNSCITSTVTVATSEWKYVADVECDLADDLPPAFGNPAEINQVILNLVVNAAHAITDALDKTPALSKGVISISTRQRDLSIEMRVTDTGSGMPPEIRDRIFDPFFSTKAVGKGTGQGLAIAHDIVVNKHGGSITVTTEEGVGTEFLITLPTGDGSAAVESGQTRS